MIMIRTRSISGLSGRQGRKSEQQSSSGYHFSNGAPGSSYATWNTWTGLLTTNNTISSTQTSQKGYVYSGLVGSDMQNGNIHFTVPDGGIFDSGDTKTKKFTRMSDCRLYMKMDIIHLMQVRIQRIFLEQQQVKRI